ncbi:hypothetical protein M0R45_020045 [Rubus argutus]|uniref:Uncharacterized protein n=1 Tax=Rubus argutus TaxID=59490 RepID=A0AAW1X8W2_RUBAR
MARNSRVLVQQLLDSGNRNPCAALLRKLPGCNFIEPVTLTSIPTTPSSPPPQIASAYRPFSSSVHASYLHYLPHRRHASTIPFETLYGHSGDLTFDRIRDESLTAVCCFYGMLDLSCRYAPPIIQRLVDQFPHVKAFHFILSDDEV